MSSREGVPLVKTLVEPSDGGNGLYQFRHLSFQESLFVKSLLEEDLSRACVCANKWQMATFLKENVNACRIGGSWLGDVVFASYPGDAGVCDLTYAELGGPGVLAIAPLLQSRAAAIVSLSLNENELGINSLPALSEILAVNATLTYLDLSSNPLVGTIVEKEYVCLRLGERENGDEEPHEPDEPDDPSSTVIDGPRSSTSDAKRRTVNTVATSGDLRGVQAFATALAASTTITSLLLADTCLGDENFAPFADALKANKALTFLSLSSNKLGAASVQALIEVVTTSTTLRSLDVSRNVLGPDGAASFVQALATTPTLVLLNLSHNEIGPSGWCSIFYQLCHQTSHFESWNLTDEDLDDRVVAALSLHIKQSTALKSLSLSMNLRISATAARHLSTAILSSASLEMLSDIPIKALREGRLTRLSTRCKCLGAVEGFVLAGLLKEAAPLESLDLSGCLFGAESCVAVLSALRSAGGHTALTLSGLQSWVSAKAVADTLQSNCLTSLDLSIFVRPETRLLNVVDNYEIEVNEMSLESAIRSLQLCERGRQGRQRAKVMKEIRMQERRELKLDSFWKNENIG
eukprot:4098311-Prymnesium_polylepis.1